MTVELSWIHFSDLHLNKNKHGWDSHHILRTLLEDMETLSNRIGKPDLIFFTGDLAYGHQVAGLSIDDQFDQAFQFFDQIQQRLRLPKHHFFIVPGNHDVNREERLSTHQAWFDSLSPTEESSTFKVAELISRAGRDWQDLRKPLSNYQAALRRFGYDHLLQDAERLCYGHTLEIQGIRVGVAGLNGVWSCGPLETRGNLRLGADWQTRYLRDRLTTDEAQVTLLLNHHPPGWYAEADSRVLERRIGQFDFFLHGHEHDAWVHPYQQTYCIAAGAAYSRTDKQKQSGYNLTKLEMRDGYLVAGRVFLRTYDPRGEGWVKQVIARTAEDGVFPLIFNQPYLYHLETSGSKLEREKLARSRELRDPLDLVIIIEPRKQPIREFISKGRSELVIGRFKDEPVDIDLTPDLLVSRPHARLTYDLGLWWIEDLGSKRGVLLDDRPIHQGRQVVLPDISLVLGQTTLKLLYKPNAPATGASLEP
ncbi:MAG: metallophosphoesterase [Acidobacteriota bacterium]|nr:metallophosphoesterase [Acidobacteriota bacterium]